MISNKEIALVKEHRVYKYFYKLGFSEETSLELAYDVITCGGAS